MRISRLLAGVTVSVMALTAMAGTGSGEKAILFVHYGTTSPEMREKALNTINEDVRSQFPGFVFMEAYTSPVVIKKLAKDGERVPTPLEALMTLRGKGIEDVTIQSSMLMNGSQTDVIILETEQMRPFFKGMTVGKPLLYTIEDSRFLSSLLTKKYEAAANKKNSAVVFVGHGGDNPGTAIYSQLDEMMSEIPGNFYVSTIEGYPNLGGLVSKLKESKIKDVTLVPLLIVGGNHIRKDIDGLWKDNLQKEGFNVTTETISLGEQPEIREWIVGKVKALIDK